MVVEFFFQEWPNPKVVKKSIIFDSSEEQTETNVCVQTDSLERIF